MRPEGWVCSLKGTHLTREPGIPGLGARMSQTLAYRKCDSLRCSAEVRADVSTLQRAATVHAFISIYMDMSMHLYPYSKRNLEKQGCEDPHRAEAAALRALENVTSKMKCVL